MVPTFWTISTRRAWVITCTIRSTRIDCTLTHISHRDRTSPCESHRNSIAVGEQFPPAKSVLQVQSAAILLAILTSGSNSPTFNTQVCWTTLHHSKARRSPLGHNRIHLCHGKKTSVSFVTCTCHRGTTSACHRARSG